MLQDCFLLAIAEVWGLLLLFISPENAVLGIPGYSLSGMQGLGLCVVLRTNIESNRCVDLLCLCSESA